VSGWNDDLAEWWLAEVQADPAYRLEVLPLAVDLLDPQPGARYLDLGCGEGGLLRSIVDAGAVGVGVDLSPRLAVAASRVAPAVVGRLPDVGFVRDASVDGVTTILVLEHLDDPGGLIAEAARVTRAGGVFVLVVNHPVLTAPGSAPVIDVDDGEALWRWGDYLGAGYTEEPAGDSGSIRFNHHTVGELMTLAAGHGWHLERLVERGIAPDRANADPLLAVQQGIPRLLGARWRRAKDGEGS
jgi:SAM-dependent methyltransferase